MQVNNDYYRSNILYYLDKQSEVANKKTLERQLIFLQKQLLEIKDEKIIENLLLMIEGTKRNILNIGDDINEI